MSIDEASRHALHEAAAHNRWTPEVAVTLMELLPPSGWGDVVRRSDLNALEARMDLRFRIVDARFEAMETVFDAKFDAVDARFEAVDARFDAIDARFDAIDARFEAVDVRFDSLEAHIDLKLEATIEKALNRSIRWTMGTMITLAGASVGAVALITNLG